MEPVHAILDSLRKAVEAMPEDVPVGLHLATMLDGAGLRDEAVRHLGAILQRDPGNTAAMALLSSSEHPPTRAPEGGTELRQLVQRGQAPQPPASGFDWSRAESEVSDLVPPTFVCDPPGNQEATA